MIKTKRQTSQIKSPFDKENVINTLAVRTIKRADAYTTNALGRAGVSTLHEAKGRIGRMKPCMRLIYARAKGQRGGNHCFVATGR
jgi:hypothetical protein